jgi:hypothetical protein
MFDKLDGFLAPLREIGRSSWQSPVPLLGLGVDGCHYAVWIDDPRDLHEAPGVVMVSPMDSYPDAIRWVAPSIESFTSLIRPDDDWLLRSDPAIANARERAEQRRASVVTAATADGMGIVERVTTGQPETPDDPEVI